jgi:uncharacterized protein YraI
MQFWNQFNWTTKAILIVLAGMIFLLGFLTLIRVGDFSFNWPFNSSVETDLIVPTPEEGVPMVSAVVDTDILGNPGNRNEILGQLEINQTAQVTGISSDQQWVLINIIQPKSGQGWISTAAVEGENLANVPVIEIGSDQTESVVIAQDAPYLTANADVDILSGPGQAYGAVGVLLAGQRAEVLGYSSDNKFWVIKVPYVEGGRGWVDADFVTPHNTFYSPAIDQAPPPPDGSESTGGIEPTIKAVANVNIRSGPDLEAGVIGLLRSGDTAKVLGVSPDRLWWAIEVPFAEMGEAWVSTDYVVAESIFDATVIEPVPIGAGMVIPTPEAQVAVLIANTRVNIRSGPSTDFEVLGRLEEGQSAKILGITSDGGWWGISVPNAENGIGWISSAFVQAINAEGVEVFN